MCVRACGDMVVGDGVMQLAGLKRDSTRSCEGVHRHAELETPISAECHEGVSQRGNARATNLPAVELNASTMLLSSSLDVPNTAREAKSRAKRLRVSGTSLAAKHQ